MTSKKDELGLRSPFERDPEIISKIGLVVTIWGTINNILRSLTADEFSCQPDQADVLLKQFSGEQSKITFLLALASTKTQPDERLVRCLEELKALSKDRNNIVHGGPIHGVKRDFYPMGMHYRDFRSTNMMTKVVGAHTILDRHLKKLRLVGEQLYLIVYQQQIEALAEVETLAAQHRE